MKKSKYLISTMNELSWYFDIAFIGYIFKYYILSNSQRSSSIIFLACWIAFFSLATMQFVTFWKGHFCTGMVPENKMYASYVGLALTTLFAQWLAFVEIKSAINIILLVTMLFFNLLYFILSSHYLFLIYFALNYFIFFFRISYLIKLI